MEQSKNELDLNLEDYTTLDSVLPKFNSIYKKNILLIDKGESAVLSNIENVSPNDIFTLGGFYGTALFKKKNQIL